MRNSIQQAGYYIPFTIYFFIFAVAGWLAWQWLHINPLQADTAFGSIFSLLLRVTLWFVTILLLFSLFTVVMAAAYTWYFKRKHKINFSINTANRENELHQEQVVQLHLSPVLKPLLGFVRLRLQYDETLFSKKFSLIQTKNGGLFSRKIEGAYHWSLPQIKEYKIAKAIIYFEDVFQFFSVAFDLPAQSRFFTHPAVRNHNPVQAWPRTTHDTSQRIDEMRKVEGEYVNYKNFENNDDVRRIVWKIYARNKELVVRIPETMDPYASHLYMFASFYSTLQVAGNKVAEIPFLNYYKQMVWTIYRQLVQKGFEVKYITDQEAGHVPQADEQQAIKYQVSVSKWQHQKDLKHFVKGKDAAVVVVSSLNEPAEVQQLIEQFGSAIHFIFIKLTDSLHSHNMVDWLQWLFVDSEKEDIDYYMRLWALSSLRQKLAKNEKQLEAIMKKHERQPVGKQ